MLEYRHYIQRCHELALLGISKTSPNPVVGAVLVANQEIIGEGWHRAYGHDHAEICALKDVRNSHRHRISEATIFVSLEPCSIHGNTPPCTDAILRENIKQVVISSRDLTSGVNEVSENILKDNGLEITYGIGHKLGDIIAAPRNVFIAQKRPYIILKWAQSADGFIAKEGERTAISNAYTQRYMHQLRSEVDAILIGKKTAKVDNPSLTNRLYTGKNPLRIILGSINIKEYRELELFTDNQKVLIYGPKSNHNYVNPIEHICIEQGTSALAQLCDDLYDRQVQKVLVEGGATTLQTFLNADLWDECRIITNPKRLGSGIKAPFFSSKNVSQSFHIMDDEISIFHNF